MQDVERCWVQRSRSQLNFVNTGSGTITFKSSFQRTTFIILHRCKTVIGRCLYIFFWSEGQGHNSILSILKYLHDNLTSFQRSAFIFHTWMQDGETKIPIHYEVQKSRSQLMFVNTLVLIRRLE